MVARMADPGKAAYFDKGDPDAVFASYLVRLRALNPANALFIYYFLRSDEYQQYADAATTGSVQRNMNAKVITGVEISLPDERVLAEFNAAVRPLRASIQAALNEVRLLAGTRDSLLPLLMSGKIRVKEAEEVVQGVVDGYRF